MPAHSANPKGFLLVRPAISVAIRTLGAGGLALRTRHAIFPASVGRKPKLEKPRREDHGKARARGAPSGIRTDVPCLPLHAGPKTQWEAAGVHLATSTAQMEWNRRIVLGASPATMADGSRSGIREVPHLPGAADFPLLRRTPLRDGTCARRVPDSAVRVTFRRTFCPCPDTLLSPRFRSVVRRRASAVLASERLASRVPP